MHTDAPHSQKRTDGRPKYILLCRDSNSADWLWRTSDDRILTVLDGRLVQSRKLPSHRTPEALLTQINSDIGIADRHYHDTFAAAFADAVEVSK